MPNPNDRHEQYDHQSGLCLVRRIRKAYLLVQEPPGVTLLMDFFPAQDTGGHKQEDNEIADKCGGDRYSGV
jgi:hypothetical protein